MMDGFIEGIIGGLLGSLGIKKEKLSPWSMALIKLVFFWLIFIPVLLVMGKMSFATLITLDFWLMSLVLYICLAFIEWIFAWGKRNREDKNN